MVLSRFGRLCKAQRGQGQSAVITSSYVFLMFTFLFPFQATQDELKVAYRRLCMLYHPDKHRDPELKRQAEQLFNLVHEAYEGKKSFCHIIQIPFWVVESSLNNSI